MNGQAAILLGLGVVSICSIGFVLTLPALAGVAMRGNRAALVRLSILLAGLAAVALAISAALGATPASYLIVV